MTNLTDLQNGDEDEGNGKANHMECVGTGAQVERLLRLVSKNGNKFRKCWDWLNTRKAGIQKLVILYCSRSSKGDL